MHFNKPHDKKGPFCDTKMKRRPVPPLHLCDSKTKQPKNFPENKKVAKEGGTIAGNARKEIESKTGRKVITQKNAKVLKLVK